MDSIFYPAAEPSRTALALKRAGYKIETTSYCEFRVMAAGCQRLLLDDAVLLSLEDVEARACSGGILRIEPCRVPDAVRAIYV